MTDLEKQVKELRDKYEEPIKKYAQAGRALHNAILYTSSDDYDRTEKLCKLNDRLFPIEADVAARCAISNMQMIDGGFNSYGVCEENVIEHITKWKTEMEKIEV